MSMRRSGRILAAVIGFALVSSGTVRAGIIPIFDPTGAYLSQTVGVAIPVPAAINTNVPIPTLSSISGNGLTVTLSPEPQSHFFSNGTISPPFNGWATWGTPPHAQSTNPGGVLWTGLPATGATSTTITLTFSHPVAAFGLEAEPGAFDRFPITATFFNGATNLGSITRSVDGLGQPLNNTSDKATAGALLFAATITPGSPLITSVQLSAPEGVPGGIAGLTGADGISFAQVRFSNTPIFIPEPGTVALLGAGIVGLFAVRRLRRGKGEEPRFS
jgi:hypothetical protein